MLDLSGSVETYYDQYVAFVRRVVHNLDMSYDRTRIGVLTYGSHTTVQFDMRAFRQKHEIASALSFHPNRGRTNTQEALMVMRTEMFTIMHGDRDGVANIAILLTDGYSNVNPQNTVPEAMRAKDEGIAIYVVPMGDNVDMREVNQIAGQSNAPSEYYVYPVHEPADTDPIADLLSDALCW